MMSFFVILGLLVCIEAPGSRAVTPVFGQKGNDLLLNVIKAVPENFLIIVWRFNGSDVLVTFSPDREPTVSKGYTGRVEVSKENYSVKLKNLQETDSGVYTARVTGAKDQIVAEYYVTVQGSRAVTPVFVKKGNDLLLNVTKADVPENFSLLTWKFNGSDNLVTFSPNNEPTVYTGRVEVSKENYSVKLKNLQETDSGVYTARVTVAKDQLVAEYYVTVQDPVPPVTLTVDSVSSSSDSCNFTVTCRTQDSDISSTFRCVNQTCRGDGGERSKVTTTGAVLHVYFVNDSIICNHSNQVSWTTNKRQRKIQDFCPLRIGTVSAGFSFCPVKTVVFSVGLIIMVSAVVCVHLMERIKKKPDLQAVMTGVQAPPTHVSFPPVPGP